MKKKQERMSHSHCVSRIEGH